MFKYSDIGKKPLRESPRPQCAADVRRQILFIDTVGSRGGAERSMFELASALVNYNVDVAAVLPEGDASSTFQSAGIKVYPCEFVRLRKPSIFHPFRKTGLFSLGSVRDVVKAAAADYFRPDCACCLIANNFAALLSAPRGTGAKIVWHVRDFPPRWQIALGIRKADYVFAISKPVFKTLCDGVSPKFRNKIHLVENGIDTSRFENAQSDSASAFKLGNSIPYNAKTVTMAANLVPWKRHDIFIETAAIIAEKYADARFVIAGADLFGEHRGYVEKLKKRAARRGLAGRLLFLDDVRDIAGLLRASAVLVHPTPSEPFGRVICEAMACCVPVVASTEGGPASIIENGATGLLVRGSNPSDWAAAVARILDSEDYAGAIAADARRSVRDVRVTAERVLEILYLSLIWGIGQSINI